MNNYFICHVTDNWNTGILEYWMKYHVQPQSPNTCNLAFDYTVKAWDENAIAKIYFHVIKSRLIEQNGIIG